MDQLKTYDESSKRFARALAVALMTFLGGVQAAHAEADPWANSGNVLDDLIKQWNLYTFEHPI